MGIFFSPIDHRPALFYRNDHRRCRECQRFYKILIESNNISFTKGQYPHTHSLRYNQLIHSALESADSTVGM